MFTIVKRLLPGADYREELEKLISENGVRAATILCAVGSLRQAHLRMADAASGSSFDGPFEIVSCTGTLGIGGLHVHLSLSDKNGKTIGGHLLPGCIVLSTIELVAADFSHEMSFDRQMDRVTGCRELVVVPGAVMET